MLSDRPYMRDTYERRPFPLLTWILGTLVAVFILENILFRWFSNPVGHAFMDWTALSTDAILQGKVWTLFTYGLLHDHNSFLHIIGNLLGLYFLGRALLPVLGIPRFLAVCGATMVTGGVFWLGVNWTHNDLLLGASAVVCGLFVVFATFNPDRPITLLLFFVLPVTLKPKTIAFALLAIDVCGLVFFELSGQRGVGIAHSAHLGGMAAGWLYFRHVHVREWKTPDAPTEMELPKWFKRAKEAAVPAPAFKVNLTSRENLRAEVDRILDKINSEGFGSLTPSEKQVLDDARDLLSKN